MEKRVLLVAPNQVVLPYPVPPLGLCQVAEALTDRYRVRVYDAMIDGGRGLDQVLDEFAPDYVGLAVRNVDNTVMNAPEQYLSEIAERFVAPLRQRFEGPLILGGSGYSIFPQAMLEALGADYGVVGEGEATMPALLAALDGGDDPAAVPGVVVATSSRKPAQRRRPLAAAVTPTARIDQWVSFDPYRQRGAYSVQTKRGCARRCIYCSYPVIEGRRYRLRSADDVADEIAGAQERLGDVTIEFVDSVFNDPPGHGEAICRAIIARGLQPRLRTMGINPAGVTKELLELMVQAGFAQIDITPDSASAAMIAALAKNFTMAELEATAELVRAKGLPTMWFLLLGGPGESPQTLAETFTFVDEHVAPEDMVRITEGIRIFPHTELRERAIADGVIDSDDDLLEPRFYVEPTLGRTRLSELVLAACATRPNCIRDVDAAPPPDLLRQAAALRAAQNLTEPMFRTLLRLRRQMLEQSDGDGASS